MPLVTDATEVREIYQEARERGVALLNLNPEAPRGIFRLRVEFSDVQGAHPPKYAVTVAGRTGHFRLRPGGGDASLADPKAGKPQKIELALAASLLRKGTNEIALACTEGSWVQYDAVTLLNEPQARMPEAAIQSVALKATPF